MKWSTYLLVFLSIFLASLNLDAQNPGKCTDGNCENGSGTIEYKNGDTYTGTFKSGLKDGNGTYNYTNGDVFVGSFKSDKRSGHFGRLTFSNGDIFSGSFVNNIGKGKLEDVYQNKIPGKLEADNRFVEDRIAYGNLVAKLKRSIVVMDSFRLENSNLFWPASNSGFMISNDKLCISNNTFRDHDFITSHLWFSDKRLRRNVRLNKVFQLSDSDIAIYQFADPVVPSFTFPTLDIEEVEVVVNSKVIAIGGKGFIDEEGIILSFDPLHRPILGEIDILSTDKVEPLFNRSGKLLGFAVSSVQNKGVIFRSSDINQLLTAAGN